MREIWGKDQWGWGPFCPILLSINQSINPAAHWLSHPVNALPNLSYYTYMYLYIYVCNINFMWLCGSQGSNWVNEEEKQSAELIRVQLQTSHNFGPLVGSPSTIWIRISLRPDWVSTPTIEMEDRDRTTSSLASTDVPSPPPRTTFGCLFWNCEKRQYRHHLARFSSSPSSGETAEGTLLGHEGDKTPGLRQWLLSHCYLVWCSLSWQEMQLTAWNGFLSCSQVSPPGGDGWHARTESKSCFQTQAL